MIDNNIKLRKPTRIKVKNGFRYFTKYELRRIIKYGTCRLHDDKWYNQRAVSRRWQQTMLKNEEQLLQDGWKKTTINIVEL